MRDQTTYKCECGHGSIDHDPWPDCNGTVPAKGTSTVTTECDCTDYRPA